MPLLEAGDIIIDGGNSEYRDSIVSTHFLGNRFHNVIIIKISKGKLACITDVI